MSISMLSVMHYVPLHNFIGMLWAIRAPPRREAVHRTPKNA